MVFFRYIFLIGTFFLFLFSSVASSNAQDFAGIEQLNSVFKSLITNVAIIGGFLAFIAFIIGGFKYITARGDPKAVAGAQATLTWAIIGLVLIIVAWLVLVFIQNFTDVGITQFNFISPFGD